MSEGKEGVRINRFLASCGVASRRKSEDLVREGRVAINGKVVSDLSTRVLADDSVKVDGKRLRSSKEVSLLLYKPRGYLCTREDTHDRKTIYDLLPPKYERLNYVGRLDKESEGLLLLTSSGELCQKLTHPKHKIEKEYHVLTDRPLDRETAESFVEGVRTSEGFAQAERVASLEKGWSSLVLRQGLKRQIRLMFGVKGFDVKRLLRVRIGELVAPNLAPGAFAELDHEGIELLSQNPTAREGKMTGFPELE